MFRVGIAALIGAQVAFLDVVQACEGECIIGITQAFVSNYTHPVAEVLAAFSRDLNNQFFLGAAQIDAARLVAPLYANFAIGAYNRTSQDIFPSYFHGKCRDKNGGVEPSGCPNPDCPVVCGTPGSLVHFYSILASIAYNSTALGLKHFAFSTSGPSYEKFESSVMEKAEQVHRRHKLRIRRSQKTLSAGHVKVRLAHLTKTYAKGAALLEACGGDEYPLCRWKSTMVPYIL
ncbi:uncharacterized protein EI90DRAFT_3046969, partial [Cantharellus anzutake]